MPPSYGEVSSPGATLEADLRETRTTATEVPETRTEGDVRTQRITRRTTVVLAGMMRPEERGEFEVLMIPKTEMLLGLGTIVAQVRTIPQFVLAIPEIRAKLLLRDAMRSRGMRRRALLPASW